MISGAVKPKQTLKELFGYFYTAISLRGSPDLQGRAGFRPGCFIQTWMLHSDLDASFSLFSSAAQPPQTEFWSWIRKKQPSIFCQAHWDPDKFSSDCERKKFDSGLRFSKPVCDCGERIDSEKDKSSQAAAPSEDTAFALRLKLGTRKVPQSLPFPHQPPRLALGKVLGQDLLPMFVACPP